MHQLLPHGIILCAARWCLRYPLPYQNVIGILAERCIPVDRSTFYRWVQKLGPELTKRIEKHLWRDSFEWHIDETYIGFSGK